MTRPEIKRSLVKLNQGEFVTLIVEATLARKAASAKSLRSLAKLIGALSGALNDADRGEIACLLRDTSDAIKRKLFESHNLQLNK